MGRRNIATSATHAPTASFLLTGQARIRRQASHDWRGKDCRDQAKRSESRSQFQRLDYIPEILTRRQLICLFARAYELELAHPGHPEIRETRSLCACIRYTRRMWRETSMQGESQILFCFQSWEGSWLSVTQLKMLTSVLHMRPTIVERSYLDTMFL